jgi:hypothetical protein
MLFTSTTASQTPSGNRCSYDQLQSWTGHPVATIKCTIQDIFEAPTIRRNQAYGELASAYYVPALTCPLRCSAEPIFLLDQCPFRNVDIVGWVSSLNYVSIEKDHEDPALRMMMTGEQYVRMSAEDY